MITLKLHTYFCDFPTCFEEVEQKLFAKIAQLLYKSQSNYTLKKEVFCLLSKVPKKISKLISASQWYELFKLLDFLFDITNTNYIADFKIGDTVFLFPDKSMEFSSVIEYAMADQALARIMDGDDQSINEFIFTICRPADKSIDFENPKWNGDRRERYSSALVSRRKTLQVPEHIQFFAVLFFLGCKQEISERYPELFRNKVVSEDTDNSKESNEPAIFSWLKLIKAVAETGLYGNYEDTCHTNLHTFCLNLCFDIEQNEKLKLQHKGNEIQ